MKEVDDDRYVLQSLHFELLSQKQFPYGKAGNEEKVSQVHLENF